jgi:AraC-like DNA-binding protein
MSAQADTAASGYIESYAADFPVGGPDGPEAFARIMVSTFDYELPTFAAAEPFFASAEIFVLPDVTVSRASATAGRFTRSLRAAAALGTDQILVICYTSGHFDLTIDGETRRVEAGELAFIDLSQEAMIEAPRFDNVSLALSRRTLETMVPFLDLAHGFVRPNDALSRLLRGLMEEIVAIGARLPVVDGRAAAGAIFQLVAGCLEPLSRRAVEAGRNTVSVVTMKSFIEQHLLDPNLAPSALLDTFGITRSTLYRLFEPLGGVSAYIAQRKLHHAFRLLSDTRYPRGRISKLATELGYSHPSVFTRAFKEAFGLSPKDVQALAGQSREQEVQLLNSPEPLQYLKPLATR